MKRFLVPAVLLLLARFVLARLGGDEATRFLAGNAVSEVELILGSGYVLVHLATVVVAPILVLSAFIDRMFALRARDRLAIKVPR